MNVEEHRRDSRSQWAPRECQSQCIDGNRYRCEYNVDRYPIWNRREACKWKKHRFDQFVGEGPEPSGWVERDELPQITQNRVCTVIDQKDCIGLEKMTGIPEVQDGIDHQHEREKSNDSEALLGGHELTGRANATIETPNGRFTWWNTLLSCASNPTSAALILFGRM